MYFWKIENLKEDIRLGRFTERDRFIYAFIYIAIVVIAFELIVFIPDYNLNIWDIINSVFNVLTAVLGTYFAYKANGSNEGKDFLGRYFAITFVVGIRMLVFLIPIFISLSLYYYYFVSLEDEDIATNALDVIPLTIWYAFYYIRVCKHHKDLT